MYDELTEGEIAKMVMDLKPNEEICICEHKNKKLKWKILGPTWIYWCPDCGSLGEAYWDKEKIDWQSPESNPCSESKDEGSGSGPSEAVNEPES